MYTFGLGQFGQLGLGTFTFESRLPQRVEHFRRGRVLHVACGENHTAVVTGNEHTGTHVHRCACDRCRGVRRRRFALHLWRRTTREVESGRRKLHQPVQTRHESALPRPPRAAGTGRWDFRVTKVHTANRK